MPAALIFIVWTWGLTPTWVNIVVTVLMGLRILNNMYEKYQEEN